MGGPDSPQSWFVNRLRRLRTSSGSPTQAQLLAYDEKKVLSRSSLSDLLAGKFTKPPPWERVAAYATACVRAAHAARIDLSPEEELARLRGDHATLTDLLEAAFREVRAPAARPAGSRTRPATYRLPPRNTHFTGRDAALRELRQRLTSGDDGAMQAVHGLGGVGKTQLAVEYAYLYRSEYRYVVFVDAEDPDLVASQFASLARELGLAEVSSEQVVPQVYGRLLDHAPWLVIFDNGERPGTLLDALPSGDLGSGGHVIVTTRRRGWSSRAGVIDLEVFTRREAVELLARRVRGMTTAVADRIAEQLGDLPLALEQAAGYMDYNHTAPEDYLALLSSRLEDMIALGELPDRPSGGGRDPVAAQRAQAGGRTAASQATAGAVRPAGARADPAGPVHRQHRTAERSRGRPGGVGHDGRCAGRSGARQARSHLPGAAPAGAGRRPRRDAGRRTHRRPGAAVPGAARGGAARHPR